MNNLEAQASSDVASLQATIIELRNEVSRLQGIIDKTTPGSGSEHPQQVIGPQFLLFRQLPFEIRYMIWKLAIHTPQIHTIFDGNTRRPFTTPSQINGLMSTCQESKAVVLGLQIPYMACSSWRTPRVFINLHLDTIYLPSGKTFPAEISFNCGVCSDRIPDDEDPRAAQECTHDLRLRHLAISRVNCGLSTHQVRNSVNCIREFNGLEELFIVAIPPGATKSPVVRFTRPWTSAKFGRFGRGMQSCADLAAMVEGEFQETFVGGRARTKVLEHEFNCSLAWREGSARLILL